MAQHIAESGVHNQQQKHFVLSQFTVSEEMLRLQLSGVQAFINFSIISILSHALQRKIGINDMIFTWFKKQKTDYLLIPFWRLQQGNLTGNIKETIFCMFASFSPTRVLVSSDHSC